MHVGKRLVLVALGVLLIPLSAVAQDEEVEVNVRNQTSNAMQVFAMWEGGPTLRLGDLNGNQTRNFTVDIRGQELTLAVQTQQQGRRAERVGGDRPESFVSVRPGDEIEWEIRNVDPFDLYLRGVTNDLASDNIETQEPRVSRYTALSAMAIQEAEGEEDEELQRQSYLEALQEILDGLTNEDNNPEAYLHLGIVHTGLANYLAADSAFDYAEALYPDYADQEFGTNAYRFNSWLEAYNDASASLEAQDPEGAIELFNLANMVFDKRPEAYLNVGAQTAGLGDLEASIEAWNNAVAVIESPDADAGDEQTREQWDTQFWLMAHTNLGRVLQRAERSDEAVTVYQTLLERFPDDADARSSLAMALVASGQADNALGIFDEILAREDGAPLDYFNAGVSLYTADQLDQAIIGFEKAIERVPMYRDALQNLVQTLNVLESHEAQIPYSERLLELDPHNEYGYQMHIRALVQMGRQADAVDLLDIMRELPFVTDNLQVQPMSNGSTVAGMAVNKTLPPGTAITLRFTFYDNDGSPLGTEDTEITLSDPEVAHQFQVEFGADQEVLGYGYEFLD
jgi:tetratricopeptide (TPR) repeat protein